MQLKNSTGLLILPTKLFRSTLSSSQLFFSSLAGRVVEYILGPLVAWIAKACAGTVSGEMSSDGFSG